MSAEPKTMEAHDIAWEKEFIAPIARVMKSKGVAYLVILIQDGKAIYTLEPAAPVEKGAL